MAGSVKLSVKGTKELQKALLRAGKRAEELVLGAMFIEGERVMSKSKREAPVGVDGNLRASGFVRPPERKGASKWVVVLGYGGAAKGYAIYQHEGIGPAVGQPAFFPPVDALKPWVAKKIAPPPEELDSVAFLVARKIGQKGLAPKKFLERPLREEAPKMAGRMARRVRAGLERG